MDNFEDLSTKPSGLFAREERSIRRGEFLPISERKYPRQGEIWRHQSGGPEYPTYYVKIVTMAFEVNNPKVIYSRCDENGIYVSIRFDKPDGTEVIMPQPFCDSLDDFLLLYERFKTSSLSI